MLRGEVWGPKESVKTMLERPGLRLGDRSERLTGRLTFILKTGISGGFFLGGGCSGRQKRGGPVVSTRIISGGGCRYQTGSRTKRNQCSTTRRAGTHLHKSEEGREKMGIEALDRWKIIRRLYRTNNSVAAPTWEGSLRAREKKSENKTGKGTMSSKKALSGRV